MEFTSMLSGFLGMGGGMGSPNRQDNGDGNS
jgi:hypothetical protein